MKQKFSTSLMGMDLMHAADQITALNDYTALFHVDIIDWHYAKNMCLFPDFIRQLSPYARKPIDVHMMVDGPEYEIAQACIAAGADIFSFQADAVEKNVFKYIELVKKNGKKFGVVLNPATPLSQIEAYLDQVDLLTFMGVTPGFAGQKLVPVVLEKIRQAIALREAGRFHFETQIDGGCHDNTMKAIHETGVDYIVLGNAFLFSHSSDIHEAWPKMEEQFTECIR